MARKHTQQLAYTAIRIEGGLIPAEELTRLTTLASPEQTEQTEAHYNIPKGLKLRDEIARNFKIAQNLWKDFQALRLRQDLEAHGTTVREFLLPLLRQALGYADLTTVAPVQATNSSHHSYQIGHAALGGRLPVVMAAHNQPIDQATERFGDTNPDTGKTRRRSPYMLAQEALNASDEAQWAVVSNGLKLRILRDNPSLTRPAYVEVDIETIFNEELYADFTAFWLLAHASRFGKLNAEAQAEPSDCAWERWRNAGQRSGETVRMNLRYQVADALRSLGTGFLSHPANTALRAQLQDPETSSATKQAFFEELLSLVYRFIFLATVEDRTDATTGRSLIFTPEASDVEVQRYWQGYSLTWLRERAVRRSSFDTHSDLWRALTITFDGLAKGQPALGLPALGGLFAAERCPLLNAAQIENRHLLTAVFQLGYFRQPTGLTRVNYRDMGAEELGSVYESLLELVPDVQHLSQPHAARLAFVGDDDQASNKGNARKLTGSYYTPDSLVQELIKSALDPVIEQTVQANPTDPVAALLQLTVCDPACGSGHFLLAAARRLADEVARLRASAQGGAPTPADYRHALRDVVSHCIYGVDKNPMAIALAKTALWLEAYTPDRPLTFIDHHLQVGDALLGVLDPKVLESGIPDEAYAVLSGDDKAVASALKKQNKAELKSWKQVVANDLFAATNLVHDAEAVEHLADDTLDGIAAKRSAWSQAHQQAQHSTLAKLADTYVAAFLAPKVADWQARIPLSGYLWGLLHPNEQQHNKPELGQAAHELCRTHSVFHWWLAFPQVAAKGGFAVMLGNPPWEVSQLSEEEFFSSRAPSIAALSGDKRKKAIAALEQEQAWLWGEYQTTKRAFEAANLFYRGAGRYPLSAVGKLNTYRLFAETIEQLVGDQGRAGFIVPTGIATDDTAKDYFAHISQNARLVSLLDFENSDAIFPAVHRSYKFSLLTIGASPSASFVCFATQVEHVADKRRQFTLTPEEFRLINPNTRTCPVFRSQRDAELTKKLYASAPVLIRESVVTGDGKGAIEVEAEANPWGISFSQGLFNMTSASDLFMNGPAPEGEASRLPLYEAKLIHQFDHRWATFIPEPGVPNDDWSSRDVTTAEKANPTYQVATRYWVDDREVLSRIARVPTRVANAWLAWHHAREAANPNEVEHDQAVREANDAVVHAIASWVAGTLFRQQAEQMAAGSASGNTVGLFEDGASTATDTSSASIVTWDAQTAWKATLATERMMADHHPVLANALKAADVTGKKALPAFQKWASQDAPQNGLSLSPTELQFLKALPSRSDGQMDLSFLDGWIDERSPRWLMGWRDICRSTDERTVIATVIPRVGVGHTMPLCYTTQTAPLTAALLANWSSLSLDYLARQKVGGTHLTYGYLKQFPVLPPERYSERELAYIVPRVLELTHTAHDMQPWVDDLLTAMPKADPRTPQERGKPLPPFPWSPERRAELRAELDAYYARLYGLTRDELRYILDPADVMGDDYPSETFRVLKDREIREFGEYRTQRLVLDAWDRQSNMSPSSENKHVEYSPHGMIRDADESRLAGLVTAMVAHRADGCTLVEIQSAIAGQASATHYLDHADGQRFQLLRNSIDMAIVASLLNQILPIVQRLEASGVLVRSTRNGSTVYARGASAPPADVILLHEHPEAARLLWQAATRREATAVTKTNATSTGPRATGTE